MLAKLKELLNSFITPESPESTQDDSMSVEERSRVAVGALLIELAASDGEYEESEKNVINNLLKNEFDLSDAEVDELIKMAGKERDKSIDLWRFTKTLNQSYTKPERIHVLEMVWKVIYADGRLDGHEDFLVHQLATLLKLEHKDLIGAKIRVKNSTT